MNQYHTISELKDHAKEKLTGNFSTAVMQTLAYNAFAFSFSIVGSTLLSFFVSFLDIFVPGSMVTTGMSSATATILSVIQYIFDLLCTIITGILNTGIALFFLNIASGQTASISNLLYGFQFTFKKSLALSAVTSLTYNVCLLPYHILYYLYGQTPSQTLLLYMVITFIIGMIVYLPISLSLSQVFFLQLDFPSYNTKEILHLSIRLMKGRKCRLFLIQLSFLPIMILGVLSFGIGTFWITPYMNMTLTLYFLDIMRPKKSDSQ